MQVPLIFRPRKVSHSWAHSLGFTLLELVLVIAILIVLAALLLPSLCGAKRHALHATCRSNLHQTGLALALYLSDFTKYPIANYSGDPWGYLLPYCGGSSKVIRCPAAQPGDMASFYGYNSTGTGCLGLGGLDLGMTMPVPETQVLVPSDMLSFGDGGFGWIAGFGYPGEYGPGSHGDYRMNAVFCDGHGEASQCNLLPHRTLEDQPWVVFFVPDSALAKRWNRDNQPHPETWP